MGRCGEPVYHNNDEDGDGDSTRTRNQEPKERGSRTEEHTRGRDRYGRGRYNVDARMDGTQEGVVVEVAECLLAQAPSP